MQLSSETLRFGRDLTTALLGVDAFYRRESGDEDGLVVVNLDEAGRFRPDPFDSYEDARRLFFWTEPQVPDGWHGAARPLTGTVVFIHP